jgi:hypothetical protein
MKKQKIGRNDPCPCNGGKKYKHCHGSGTPQPTIGPVELPDCSPASKVRVISPASVPHEIRAGLIAQQAREADRQRRFGLVRPEIAMDFHGYKFVAIGGKLLYRPSEQCRFFTDVLIAYVPQMFGREWFEAEIAKPMERRHPVMQWRIKGMNYMNVQPRQPDGSYAAVPTGPLLAYLTFAYDLYVVEHNARLDDRLVERLKQMDQFQGARHELFAQATCLRAGFKIENEDETDRSSRHAEFTATHLATGEKISVEAKSKHRPGVLGRPGIPEVVGKVNLKFGRLLRDAIKKNPPHPLVVFLDMNMSFESANRFLAWLPPGRPHPYITKTLDVIRREHNGRDPISLLMMTSHPGHHTKDDEIPRQGHMMGQISLLPARPANNLEALKAIVNATNLYGQIPQELPSAGTVPTVISPHEMRIS